MNGQRSRSHKCQGHMKVKARQQYANEKALLNKRKCVHVLTNTSWRKTELYLVSFLLKKFKGDHGLI